MRLTKSALALFVLADTSSVAIAGEPSALTPAPPASEAFATAITRARKLLEKEVAPQVPGFSVAVAVDGKTVWSEGFGFADLEESRRATPDTRFRIGSVSKCLTAAGLALLVERGVLDLDTPVQTYVPEFPVKTGIVTTRLLAGHLAGIRHYAGEESRTLNQPFASVRAGLKIFEDDPLVALPGTKFSYSTYGWSLISAVMESAAKKDFLAFMAADVFQPLGLEQTRPDRAGATDPMCTQFYDRDAQGRFIVAAPVDSSYKWAGGGFLSTSEDLVRFGSALIKPGFLKSDSLALLFTSQKTADGKLTGYGIGWYVQEAPKGHKFVFHTGGQAGGSALLFIRPESGVVVAVLCNVGEAPLPGKGLAIADFFAPVGNKSTVKTN
jgi:CubicO group peptidase (beta-lactamase class C family)